MNLNFHNILSKIILIPGFLFISCSIQKIADQEKVEILNAANINPPIVTDDSIKHLPDNVQTWLRNSGAKNQIIRSASIKQKALMQFKKEQTEWYKADAWQTSTVHPPAFVWTVSLPMNPIMHITGRDKYQNGHGAMLIRLNSLLNIVHESGPKIDEGSMQRFLGEMVWMPNLALSPYITWEKLDKHSAKATMNYQGVIGSGIFYFNDRGDFIRFEAMRYKGNDSDAKRFPWILTVQEHATFQSIRIPSKMKATWKLDDGDWTWLILEIENISYQ